MGPSERPRYQTVCKAAGLIQGPENALSSTTVTDNGKISHVIPGPVNAWALIRAKCDLSWNWTEGRCLHPKKHCLHDTQTVDRLTIACRPVIKKVDSAKPARFPGLSKITVLRAVQCEKADSAQWVTDDRTVIDAKSL
jgi:hypothetical protein